MAITFPLKKYGYYVKNSTLNTEQQARATTISARVLRDIEKRTGSWTYAQNEVWYFSGNNKKYIDFKFSNVVNISEVAEYDGANYEPLVVDTEWKFDETGQRVYRTDDYVFEVPFGLFVDYEKPDKNYKLTLDTGWNTLDDVGAVHPDWVQYWFELTAILAEGGETQPGETPSRKSDLSLYTRLLNRYFPKVEFTVY